MSFDGGINFRATNTFASDGTNETYSLGEGYPVTRGGMVFGWSVGAPQARDRNAALDRRMAGSHWLATAGSGGSQSTFRLDLPHTGTYDIALALGDYGGYGNDIDVSVQDNGSTFASIVAAGISHNTWEDASGVNRSSDSDWATNQVTIRHTFTSTIIQVVLNVPSVSPNAISHLRVTEVASAPSAPPEPPETRYRPRALRRGPWARRSPPYEVGEIPPVSLVGTEQEIRHVPKGWRNRMPWRFRAPVSIVGEIPPVSLIGTEQEIRHVPQGWRNRMPWRFRALQQGVIIASGQSYSYTAAGGLTFSGTSAELRVAAPAPSGGLTFGGASTQLRIRVPAPAGGLQFGGAASFAKGWQYSAAGGLTFGGASAQSRVKVESVSGGIVFGGHANESSSGSQSYSYSASGGIVFAGAAPQSRSKVESISGGIVFAGGATVSFHVAKITVSASGGITFAGGANYSTFTAGGSTEVYRAFIRDFVRDVVRDIVRSLPL